MQLGIYGACVKIAMIMTLLTQAFRYAYEPIVFAGKDKASPDTLPEGMKYFVLFTIFAWLAVMIWMPVLRHFIQPDYWEGLKVVPIVMAAEIFMGIYFNLSFWYKLSDQTWWGAVMSAAGALAMVLVNVLLVPKMGYMACAWGGFVGYGIEMLLSFFVGRKKYPVHYDLRTMGCFLLLAALMYVFFSGVRSRVPLWASLLIGTVLLLGYLLLVYKEIKRNKR